MTETKSANRLMKVADVCEITRVPKSSLYKKIKSDDFPKPVKLGKRAVAWRAVEVEAWIESRLAA